MLEKDIENLIASYPDEFFPGESFVLIGQQITINGRRLDILFEDKHKRKIIIEVKRGILTREASGQIAEYYGLLKNEDEHSNIELILCANIIPKERKTFLETIGIACKELGVVSIIELAKRKDYKFIDDQSMYSLLPPGDMPKLNHLITEQSTISDNGDISIWLFQANANRYDILNALSDKEIGNSLHWYVNQNKNNIHKGNLAMLWVSGKEAGIYAVTRVECEPEYMAESLPEKKYWLGNETSEVALRVRLTIIKRLINKPILKSELLKIPELSNLSILRQSQGTNFPVRDSEWQIISQFI